MITTQVMVEKKGRELKCQFDFQPLKVENRFKLRACKWCGTYCWILGIALNYVCKWRATYCWKNFDKGYNFSLPHFNQRSSQKL